MTTQKLKEWVNEDIKDYINLDLVDNVPDLEKPLSDPQKDYIHLKIKDVKDTYTPVLDNLVKTKADLVNGIVPLNQLPLDLRMEGTTNVSFGNFSDMITNSIISNNVYVQSLIDVAMTKHLAEEDPHQSMSELLVKVDQLADTTLDLIEDKISKDELDVRLPKKLTFDALSDTELRISLVGEDGITRSVTLSLT